MNRKDEREAFLSLLAINEDDTTCRLIYADWLDDHGEHEEADRQRKWPASKAWLMQFCKQNNRTEYEEFEISYSLLLELAREAVDTRDEDGIGFSCGNNMTMCDALRKNSKEFWEKWSIVTGTPLPEEALNKSYFSCGC